MQGQTESFVPCWIPHSGPQSKYLNGSPYDVKLQRRFCRTSVEESAKIMSQWSPAGSAWGVRLFGTFHPAQRLKNLWV